MSSAMSVSMTVKIIDEATGPVRNLTGAMRELKAAGADLNASTSAGSTGRWEAEKRAVEGVTGAVRALGDMQQETASIGAAVEGYRREAGAVQGVIEKMGALRAATAEAAAPIDAALGKLREEATAVQAITTAMREMSRIQPPIPPAGGPFVSSVARGGAGGTGVVDWGAQAGRNRDWRAHWQERGLIPPDSEPEPTAIHPAPPREPEPAPRASDVITPPAAAGGGGLISMIVSGAELSSGLKLLRGSYEQAAEAESQRAAMVAAGLTTGEQGELAAASSRVSREKRTFSENEVLDMARDARTILGSTSHAVEALPNIVALAQLAEAKRPGQGMEGVMSLLKGMETSGATVTPERFGEMAQSLAKVTNVLGKTVQFADWGQYFKYGGTATQHFSPEFTEQKAPHLIQDLTGSSAGTMLQTMYRTIVGGRMDKGAKEVMEQYGLYNPETGKVTGADRFMRDPSDWVMNVMKPKLDEKHLTEDDRAAVEDKMFSSRLAARGISILESQDAAVEKNARQIRAAPGLEAAPELARTDPRLVQRGASAQSSNFEQRAGSPVMSPLIAMQNAYTTALGGLNTVFDKVPGAATAAAAGIVSGAGYLGWKTWESGLGETVKSVLRVPESVGRGLIEGARDGVAEARAEVGQTAASRAATAAEVPATRATTAAGEAPAAQGLASVGEAASTLGTRFAALSTDLGTIGMLAAWAGRGDMGMPRPPTPAHLAENPLGIHLPGDPETPAQAVRATEASSSIVPAMYDLTEALREQARRSAEEFRRDPEAARGRAMMENGAVGIQAAVSAAVAAAQAAAPKPVTTAAQPAQIVTNNQQKYVTAPIAVTAPITINATLTNTTPGAIANTVAHGIHTAVRASTAALHDGTETK